MFTLFPARTGPNRLSGSTALVAIALCAVACAVPSTPVRIKDIASVSGAVGQPLMGYGLVVGLEGTGDSSKSTLTAQALANMLEHFDLKVSPGDLCTENVAAVMVTATLPHTAVPGDRIDVTVASVGDATSLYGAILLPTALKANDSDVYAIARGPVSIGGLSASGGGQKVQKAHPVAARIVDGATVLKAVPPQSSPESVCFSLRQADFTTAMRICSAINEHFAMPIASPLAAESVQISIPADRRKDVVGFIAEVESINVVGDAPARVVVNERTGTVIIGGDVRILPVAIAHGSLTISISRRFDVSQPPPFSGGTTVLGGDHLDKPGAGEDPLPPNTEIPSSPGGLPGGRTVVTRATDLDVEEAEGSLVEFRPQTRLSDLVEALNSLGVKPRDLMAILQALKAANALQAELVFI
ncbi:MAG: flagellar basal body P-ring protein FlgI [Armatimonadetes bacterium]|nr:flagellar basal body P-ring protein FlgI [Armatimonadota bacterium]